MDSRIATRIVEFIHEATGRFAIVCDVDGVITAAKVGSRIGNVHEGARRMLRDKLPEALVTMEDEKASSGAMKAGCNLPIHYKGELIGSIGVAGDPAMTEPVTRMASGLIAKELQERETLDLLIGHAAQMVESVDAIVSMVDRADASQGQVATVVDEMERLIEASSDDIARTGEVIGTIQSIASNTQMLGLNAAIEAAHAGEHGRGFSIVAESVRKLSTQCSEAAESVRGTQTHLHTSMNQVAVSSKHLLASTHDQSRITRAIAERVAELKTVSSGLMEMTRS